jgi:hypothetical protein
VKINFVLFMALMASVVLASWNVEAEPVDDFVRRYAALAAEARSVWNEARLQQPTISDKRLRLQIEILNLSERTYLLTAEVQTFLTGFLESRLESKVLTKSKLSERLTLVANRGQLLGAWLSLLSAYFDSGRPIYLQVATQTYNTWEMLEKLR